MTGCVEVIAHQNELPCHMTVTQALAIFSWFGIDVAGMAPDQLRKARNKLAMTHHPDHGGAAEALTAINDAYDFLKIHGTTPPQKKPIGQLHQSHQDYSRDSHTSGRMPAWALAGYSGGSLPNTEIYKNDFSDANFFKKAMWELSGKSTTAYTIWGFDGHFFSSSIMAFGSPKIFDTMADAMVKWQSKSENPREIRAVLVSPFQGQGLYLIYADGIYYGDQPIQMEHQSFNANPNNDQEFTRILPEILDRLKATSSSG
jgi:curved DNA-binding protein CbpA